MDDEDDTLTTIRDLVRLWEKGWQRPENVLAVIETELVQWRSRHPKRIS